MKASLAALLLAISCSALADAQSNPYPTGCWTFTIYTLYCNDVDPGQGSCHGSLPYVIDYPDEDDGLYDGQFDTLACTGGTNQCQGNNSPTCPTCPSVSGYVTEVYNPLCTEGDGGGGDGGDCSCDGSPPMCPADMCDLFKQAPKSGKPSGSIDMIALRKKSAQLERNILEADHRLN